MKAGEEPLVVLRFNNGDVVYTYDFRLLFHGHLYPRQLKAANAIIQIFKTSMRDDKDAKDLQQ